MQRLLIFSKLQLRELWLDGWQLLYPLIYVALMAVFLGLGGQLGNEQLTALLLLVIFMASSSQSLHIFSEDLQTGALLQYQLNAELQLYIQVRIWLWCMGSFVPIFLCALILWLIGSLSFILVLNLMLAAPAIAWCSALGGALSASLKRGYLLTFIVTMPLLLPVFLLLLVSTTHAASSWFIASFSVFAAATMPLACRSILKQIIYN